MMRSDFYFMKEMASKMHIPAHSRHERLKTFVDDVIQYAPVNVFVVLS